MITFGRISIPLGMAPPTWWTAQEAERRRQFAELERKTAEMARTVRENSPRRRDAPSSRSQGDPASRASARLSAAAIYEARAAQAALPRGRDPLCAKSCYETTQNREACDAIMCRASVKMRLDLARERRPR
jgi:hypothetical protein